MKIVFVSNYFNHHQKPLCDELYALTGGAFCFIETAQMRQERKALGYGEEKPSYVYSTLHGNEQSCLDFIMDADVLICGSAPEKYLRKKIRSGSPVFRYSERPLKNGLEMHKYIPRLVRWHLRNPIGKPIYMLCASGFTAWDYSRLGLFRNRCYRWGYFPPVKKYDDITSVLQKKDHSRILWVARLLPVKHPEMVIEAAKRLKEQGYSFCVDIVGIGEMEELLRNKIQEYDLSGHIRLLGAMKPEQVRSHMENAGIFLFTSDKGEGWGAVVNEAMNSGCAVVASHAAGSVPYLLQDGENGQIFRSGDPESAYEKLAFLLENSQQQVRLGENAYRTITKLWNAETAASRLYALAERLLEGCKYPQLFDHGPCSKAEKIKDDWFK